MIRKIKNGELIEIANGIARLQKREETYGNNGKSLLGNRIRVAYAIRKNKTEILKKLEPYNEELRELIKKYNSPEAQKTGALKIREDCIEEWKTQLKELQDIEVEVNIHSISLADLEGLEIGSIGLEELDFMIAD